MEHKDVHLEEMLDETHAKIINKKHKKTFEDRLTSYHHTSVLGAGEDILTIKTIPTITPKTPKPLKIRLFRSSIHEFHEADATHKLAGL